MRAGIPPPAWQQTASCTNGYWAYPIRINAAVISSRIAIVDSCGIVLTIGNLLHCTAQYFTGNVSLAAG